MNSWFKERSALCALAATLLIGITAGMTVGWGLWRPRKRTTALPATEIRQRDNSLVLAVKPDATAKPAQQVPRGAAVERVGQVTIRPRASVADLPPIPGSIEMVHLPAPCSPPFGKVRIDYSVFRMRDDSIRVGISSPDADVEGGIDIPIVNAKPAERELKWCVGGVYGVSAWGDKSLGVFVERDLAFLRTGLDVTKTTLSEPMLTGGRTHIWEARVRIGVQF